MDHRVKPGDDNLLDVLTYLLTAGAGICSIAFKIAWEKSSVS